MNTYEVIEQGNPIIPYILKIDLDVNANCTYTERVATTIPRGSEFNAFFDGYVLNSENAYKSHSDFSTQDENRNATWSVVEIGQNIDFPEKTDYDLIYSFTVNDAVATFNISCQSSQISENLEAFFGEKVNEVEYDFYNVRPQWSKL